MKEAPEDGSSQRSLSLIMAAKEFPSTYAKPGGKRGIIWIASRSFDKVFAYPHPSHGVGWIDVKLHNCLIPPTPLVK